MTEFRELTPAPDYYFLFGAGITLAPLVAALAAKLHARQARKESSHGPAPGVGALLLRETTTVVDQEQTQTINPTSIEFEQSFVAILKEALGSEPNRRLVIVIDNLDRIERQPALSVWSTLQTFLQRDAVVRAPWMQQVWVIVPHAVSAVDRLHRLEGAAPANETTENIQANGHAFLEKSIQIQVPLPLAVTSNWREFFLAKLGIALPDHARRDLEDVLLVYNALRTQAHKPPTPREIKTFINDLGAMHRIRDHDFPLSHLAYYVLQLRVSPDLATSIGSAWKPPEWHFTIVGEGIVEDMAALLFGTDTKTAQQILWTDKLIAGLTSEDALGLDLLVEIPGFWPALDFVLRREVPGWKLNKPDYVAAAAHHLTASKIMPRAPEGWEEPVIARLQEAARGVPHWTINVPVINGLIAILSMRHDESLAQHLFGIVSNSLHVDDRVSAEHSLDEAEAFVHFLNGLHDLGYEAAMGGGVRFDSDASNFLPFAQRLVEGDPTKRHWNRITVEEPEKLKASIIGALAHGKFNNFMLAGVRFLAHRYAMDWSEFGSQLTRVLRTVNSSNVTGAVEMIRAALILREDKKVAAALGEVVSSGALANLFAGADRASQELAISIVASLAVHGAILPSGSLGSSGRWVETAKKDGSSPTPAFAAEVAALVDEYDLYEELWASFESARFAEPLLRSVVADLSHGEPILRKLPPTQILKNWPRTKNFVQTPELVFESGWLGSMGNELIATKFKPSLADAYTWAIRLLPDRADLRSAASVGLTQLPSSEWNERALADGPVIELAELLRDRDGFTLSTHYREAVRTFGIGLVTRAKLTDSAPIASRILHLLGLDDQQSIMQEIAQAVVETPNVRAPIFHVFGRELVDVMKPREDMEPLLVSWVQNRNPSALNWLHSALSADSDFLNSASQHTLLRTLEAAEVRADQAQPIIDSLRGQLSGKESTC